MTSFQFQQQWVGGPGHIVEIDESKFGKRKYNKGHPVGDKSWVFGGICRTDKNFLQLLLGTGQQILYLNVSDSILLLGQQSTVMVGRLMVGLPILKGLTIPIRL